jgi:hypothetical protein
MLCLLCLTNALLRSTSIALQMREEPLIPWDWLVRQGALQAAGQALGDVLARVLAEVPAHHPSSPRRGWQLDDR